MHWSEIEKKGRAKYDLAADVWFLVGADATDREVMKVEFSKKGPRGGWLRGPGNRFKGYIVYEREEN